MALGYDAAVADCVLPLAVLAPRDLDAFFSSVMILQALRDEEGAVEYAFFSALLRESEHSSVADAPLVWDLEDDGCVVEGLVVVDVFFRECGAVLLDGVRDLAHHPRLAECRHD